VIDNDMQTRIDALEKLRDSERPKSMLEIRAYDRQINDLKTGHERGLYWDESEVIRNLRFISKLQHWKGRFKGKPFIPEPWQEQLVIAPLCGWYKKQSRKDGGYRRFTTSYLEIPRKNGKTALAACLGVQGLVADREEGAEVYAFATKYDQACIIFRDMVNFTKNKFFEPLIKHCAHHIEGVKNKGVLKPLASDHHSLDGLNCSRAIGDELHVLKSRDLWDVINESMGMRENPQIIGITTAGYDRSSFCYELHKTSVSLLNGEKEDDTFHCLICHADQEDDILDFNTWWKANPNLDVTIRSDWLSKEALQASQSPSKENNFRRKHLNQWTQSSVKWIPENRWEQCEDKNITDVYLQGLPCYMGVDLASTRDVCACGLVWQTEDGDFIVKCVYWAPENSISERANTDRAEVLRWMQLGYIRGCPGDVSDVTNTIPSDIVELIEKYKVSGVAYDPKWGGEAFRQNLINRNIDSEMLIAYPNTAVNMTAPTTELERFVYSKTVKHDGDPVLRWMIGNVTIKQDANGLVRPDKSKSSDKIDGVVAILMAIGLCRKMYEQEPQGGLMLL
jgi:phage terminase large subunit-like protein